MAPSAMGPQTQGACLSFGGFYSFKAAPLPTEEPTGGVKMGLAGPLQAFPKAGRGGAGGSCILSNPLSRRSQRQSGDAFRCTSSAPEGRGPVTEATRPGQSRAARGAAAA